MKSVARSLTLFGIGGLIGWALVTIITLEPNWVLCLLWGLLVCVSGAICLLLSNEEGK